MSQPLSRYEEERALRIAENVRRMRELGVLDAVQEVHSSQAPLRASRPGPRMKHTHVFVEVELRRSAR